MVDKFDPSNLKAAFKIRCGPVSTSIGKAWPSRRQCGRSRWLVSQTKRRCRLHDYRCIAEVGKLNYKADVSTHNEVFYVTVSNELLTRYAVAINSRDWQLLAWPTEAKDKVQKPCQSDE